MLVLVRKAPYEFGVTSIEAMNGFSKVHPSNNIVNHVTTVFIASIGLCAITRPLIGNPFWPGVMHVAPTLNPCWLLLANALFDMDQSLEPPLNCDMIMVTGFMISSTRSLSDISTVIFVSHVTLTPALGKKSCDILAKVNVMPVGSPGKIGKPKGAGKDGAVTGGMVGKVGCEKGGKVGNVRLG